MEQNSVLVENVTKAFRFKHRKGVTQVMSSKPLTKIIALDDISFKVKRGEMVGVIGANGSGKTTLLRAIAGIYNPDLGQIRIDGRIAPILQIGAGFREELDAKENIALLGMLMGFSKDEIQQKTDSVLSFAELEDFTDMKLRYFSAGMRARLGFSIALQVNPDVLLVDEVLSVGDEAFREKSFKEFLSFKAKGKTILYTTHNLNTVSKLSDKVLLLDHGKNIMIGEPVEVIEKYKEIILKK